MGHTASTCMPHSTSKLLLNEMIRVNFESLFFCTNTHTHTHTRTFAHRSVRNCILDGEMIAWDTQANAFVAKGLNVDVKHLGVPDDDGVIRVSLRENACQYIWNVRVCVC